MMIQRQGARIRNFVKPVAETSFKQSASHCRHVYNGGFSAICVSA